MPRGSERSKCARFSGPLRSFQHEYAIDLATGLPHPRHRADCELCPDRARIHRIRGSKIDSEQSVETADAVPMKRTQVEVYGIELVLLRNQVDGVVHFAWRELGAARFLGKPGNQCRLVDIGDRRWKARVSVRIDRRSLEEAGTLVSQIKCDRVEHSWVLGKQGHCVAEG